MPTAEYFASLAKDSPAGQALLFDRTKPAVLTETVAIPEQFYDDGYAVVKDIASAYDAYRFLQRFIPSIDPARVPMVGRFQKRMQLAKADRFSVCCDADATHFQPLHFGMGHPLLEGREPQMFLLMALYCPPESASAATMRVATVQKLLRQRAWGAPETIDLRIQNYVDQYGDHVRLAYFAHLLDAIAGKKALAERMHQPLEEHFRGPRHEQDFYALCGVDALNVEAAIVLQPGQLLLIDNLRAVHGNDGRREAGELYQLMYGLERASAEDIAAIRMHLVEQCL